MDKQVSQNETLLIKKKMKVQDSGSAQSGSVVFFFALCIGGCGGNKTL